MSGINVIYGKNGLGKTTLLHIIANLSEIDIERFNHLSFTKISLSDSDGQEIRLEKYDQSISVFINDQKTSYETGGGLSELESERIKSIVGPRATYLPAFRSVLERMRESTTYSSYEERAKPEYEALRRIEFQSLQAMRGSERIMRRENNLIDTNVTKTLRCRDWFGQFVPAIRYPSITDVLSGLTDEWTSAQIAISKVEQKQFETAFVEIFSAIAKGNVEKDGINQSVLLDEIRDLVSPEEDNVVGPHQQTAYAELVNIAENNKGGDRNYGNILEIYRNKLRDRKSEREDILKPIHDFQNSINVFLSEKVLKIGSRQIGRLPRVRDASVLIEPSSGKPYRVTALSSGERQILTMLYSASRSLFQSGCCLIDEPELSLHVDWQRIILSHIEKQHHGRQIIACTHSPEVGADHDDRVLFFAPLASDVCDVDMDIDDGVGL